MTLNTYTWVIDALDCIPDGNVVSNVHWRVNATDGTHNATVYGAQAIEHNAKNPFTAYEALTKDTVVAWVQEAMGIDAVTRLQEALDKQLETLANPPVITPPLPWTE